MSEHQVCELGPMVLQCGITLPAVRLAYRTYGRLSPARDNAVLMPTFFGGQHADTEPMMAPGRALDPSRYHVIVVDMLGNGLSSSPSNTPVPFEGPAFPPLTLQDQVSCQHRLVTEHLGIRHLRLVVGFSMGAQQAFQWGSQYPGMMDAIAPICGSARTSIHNRLLLDGARAALTAAEDFDSGFYRSPPARALGAFTRVYCSLVATADFYRAGEYAKLGLASPEDTMRMFEGRFRGQDANDLLALLSTWQRADVSANETYRGDLASALGAVTARAIVLPCVQDQLFPLGEIAREVELMPNAELRPIDSSWGHLAGLGANPPDNRLVDEALLRLLAG